jgi:predicted transcriptional regulator of viral defense system
MQKIASGYSQISSIQRLGYLFDKIYDRQDLANAIRRTLKTKNTQNILLSISSPKKGNIDKDWKVDVNVIIENDL